MPSLEAPPLSIVRFATFEVDLEARQLRKRGVEVRLQEQPFRVLATLLERPGQIVTRGELRDRLWARETFVDFDRAVNKAINRIREALGDLAASPRFVETLPRRGYRFIAPINEGSVGASGAADNPASSSLVRSSLLPPPDLSFLPLHFSLSPNGRWLAFVAADQDGTEALWLRDLSSAAVRPLAGAGGPKFPFWSPDSRSVGFFAGRALKTVDIVGGTVRTICDAPMALGGAWHADDVILFAGHVAGPLHRVPAGGGTPQRVTPLPGADSSEVHCWPVFLPGSDRFLFFVNRTGFGSPVRNGIYVGSLGSPDVRLVSGEVQGNVQIARGHVFFVSGGALMAQAIDLERTELVGVPLTLVQHELEIWERAWHRAGFSVSAAGPLVFQSSRDFASALVWTDPSGGEVGRLPQSGWGPSISPDGRFVAIACDDAHDGRWRICVHDRDRRVVTRLTEGGCEWHPSWSNAGTAIIYDSTAGNHSCTYEIPVDGTTGPRLLLERGSVAAHRATNGAIVFMRLASGRVSLAVQSPNQPEATPLGPGAEPQFSPDGQWIAFVEPGGGGVSVRPLTGTGARIQISSAPGAQPRWSRDGRELFHIAADKKLIAVSFDPLTGQAGAPRELFQTRIIATVLIGFQYDVDRDGRFLIHSLPAASSPLTLLTGWAPLLNAESV